MDKEEHDKNYFLIKENLNLKEYIFLLMVVIAIFFVLGTDLKDAEEYFTRIDLMKRNGFILEDLLLRLEYDKEKCKNWSKDKYRDNNENVKTKRVFSENQNQQTKLF